MRGRGKEGRRKVAGAAVVLKGGARDEGVEGVGKGREEKRGEASPRHQTRLVVYPKAV